MARNSRNAVIYSRLGEFSPNPHFNSHSQAVCVRTCWCVGQKTITPASGLVMKVGCSPCPTFGCSWLLGASERETRPQPARHNATLIDGAGWREMSRGREREKKRPGVSVGRSTSSIPTLFCSLSLSDRTHSLRRRLRLAQSPSPRGDAILECIHRMTLDQRNVRWDHPTAKVAQQTSQERFIWTGRCTDQSDGNSFADGSTIYSGALCLKTSLMSAEICFLFRSNIFVYRN